MVQEEGLQLNFGKTSKNTDLQIPRFKMGTAVANKKYHHTTSESQKSHSDLGTKTESDQPAFLLWLEAKSAKLQISSS